MDLPRRVTALASVVLAPNPGPMTLEGTNSYLLRSRDQDGGTADAGTDSPPAIVVDPGPEDAGHLAALADAGPVGLILITHQHTDHTAGARALHELTGAPVRAPLPDDCIDADPLVPGEQLEYGGVRIDVVGTPGHTADSVCFVLPDDEPLNEPLNEPLKESRVGAAGVGSGSSATATGSVLTGDTVLGRGSTVIGIPDGTLAQYLGSLRRLAALGTIPALPAHGPQITDVSAACAAYLAHREQRLDQVREALRHLGLAASEATVGQVADVVYGDVDPAVRFAAEHSVAAQLAYLRDADSA